MAGTWQVPPRYIAFEVAFTKILRRTPTRRTGRDRQPMMGEAAPHGLLRNGDEAAIEQLRDEGEGRPVAAVVGHDEMRRLVQNQEAIKMTALDRDAMVGDVGEA